MALMPCRLSLKRLSFASDSCLFDVQAYCELKPSTDFHLPSMVLTHLRFASLFAVCLHLPVSPPAPLQQHIFRDKFHRNMVPV